MSDNELFQQIDALRAKLQRANVRLAGLRAKAKYLELHYEDARERERNANDLVTELLERQKELNVMLNRANIMLNRTQEAMALTSMEFNEMAKSLPEPKKAEWSSRIARINELFKKTGVQDAEVVGLESSNPQLAESLETDELQRESDQVFRVDEAVWTRKSARTPPGVDAEPLDDESSLAEAQAPHAPAAHALRSEAAEESQEVPDEDSLIFPPRRKPWWRRVAS